MLTTTGILAIEDAAAVGVIPGLLRSYRTIAVTPRQRVVQVPPIGSFLVDWDERSVRVHVSAATQRELDDLVRGLELEVARVGGNRLHLAWAQTAPV